MFRSFMGWCVAFAFTLLNFSAMADGAVAITLPIDVAKQGISFGWSSNWPTSEEARAHALKRCREQNAERASLCRIVTTFKNECFANAYDPKEGTPGVGWAFAPTRELAESRAIENCETTVGPGRNGTCVIGKDTPVCDNSS